MGLGPLLLVMFLMMLLLCMVAGSAAASTCDGSYTCGLTVVVDSDDDTTYTFDFRELCSLTDFVTVDSLGRDYYARVCGNASRACLQQGGGGGPFDIGVAVQMWGEPPSCSPPGCVDPVTGRAVCCTAPCVVRAEPRPPAAARTRAALHASGACRRVTLAAVPAGARVRCTHVVPD